MVLPFSLVNLNISISNVSHTLFIKGLWSVRCCASLIFCCAEAVLMAVIIQTNKMLLVILLSYFDHLQCLNIYKQTSYCNNVAFIKKYFYFWTKTIYMSAIPKSFEEWRICIEQKCGIPLTLEFAEKRLSTYMNENLPETQHFVKLYGDDHLTNIKEWLSRAIAEKRKLGI